MLWLDERCVHMRVCTKLDTKLLHCMCMHWSCKHEMRNRFGLMNTQSELTFLLTDETWKIFATVLYFSWLLNSQEEQIKGGTVVRTLTSHQCCPGSNSSLDTLYVGWVCCSFSPLFWEVLPWVLQFSLLSVQRN